MITDTTCETCEYFAAGKSRCALRHMFTARSMDCPLWRGKHGEWIPMALCKPEDKEIVLLQGEGQFEYNAESGSFDSITDCFDRVPADNVRCWMRIPRTGI